MKIASLSSLFTGGMNGNLGFFLFATLLLLLPNIFLFFKAIRIQFYFLKFLQYPGLIIFSFYMFVFFCRQDRWLLENWQDNYKHFAIYSSIATNAFSLFLLRRAQTVLKIVVPLFVILGLGIYFMI